MLKRKKSFFNIMLNNFILLLCIPLITILLIFAHSDKMVREQVVDSSTKNFELYYEQIEKIMQDMRNTCMTIYDNKHCKLYSLDTISSSSIDAELKQKVHSDLTSLTRGKEQYYDVFIYYYRNNRIISSNRTSMTAERYYEAYYGNINQEDYREDFLAVLKQDNTMPICRVIQDYTGEKYICMTLGYRSNRDETLNYTICVVLSPDTLNQILRTKDKNKGNIFLIYNEDNQKLLSNNNEFETFEIENHLNRESNSNTWFNIDNYMLQIRGSEILKNQYIYIIASKQFWIVVRHLRIYCVLGILVCAIVSIVFAYRSAKTAYKPVKNIVDYVASTKSGINLEKEIDNEFSYILSYIKDNNNFLKESKKTNQELYLRKILDGKITDKNCSEFAKNGLSFPYKNFGVCILHIDSVNETIKDLYHFIIKNVFEELGDTIGKAYIVELSETNCVYLVNAEESDANLEKILSEGQIFLKQHFQIILTIGCSNIHHSIVDVSEAYKEAQEAVKYRFLMGFGGRIFYGEVRKRSLTSRNNGESKIYMMMLNFVKQNYKNQSVVSFVDNLVQIYEVNERVSIEIAYLFKMEIIDAINKIMEVHDYDEELRLDAIKKMHEADSLLIFKDILCDHISKLCEEKTYKRAKEDICIKVKSYIEKNYDDNQMSVAMIGKEMGMQAAHLSKLFKETYGITILDYIASVRICEAKQMIREERMSVQDAAKKVGFINSHAFIRIFKKMENITPGKYKELCEHKK